MTAAEILAELVAIPTVSHLSNRPLIERLERWFAELGWHQKTFCYIDGNNVQKVNLIVSPRPLSDRTIHAKLAVVCHTDTVPFEESWIDALQLQERDGTLHGLGSCDVKGFMACMLLAAAGIEPHRLDASLVLVFTADEEIGCKGARFLLSSDILRVSAAIVGEPTSLRPARAGKGYALAEVLVSGRSAHSAYPEQGRSAILAAAAILRDIEQLALQLQADRNEAFSPAWTTINVGTIHGGTAKNVVPAECRFLVEWRPIPAQDPEFVAHHLRRITERHSTNGISASVEVQRLDPGFETPAASPVIAALLADSRAEPVTLSFGTEAPWLARMGAEAVVFGPGSMLSAHSPRECVQTSELDECVRMLRAAIELLCIEEKKRA